MAQFKPEDVYDQVTHIRDHFSQSNKTVTLGISLITTAYVYVLSIFYILGVWESKGNVSSEPFHNALKFVQELLGVDIETEFLSPNSALNNGGRLG